MNSMNSSMVGDSPIQTTGQGQQRYMRGSASRRRGLSDTRDTASVSLMDRDDHSPSQRERHREISRKQDLMRMLSPERGDPPLNR